MNFCMLGCWHYSQTSLFTNIPKLDNYKVPKHLSLSFSPPLSHFLSLLPPSFSLFFFISLSPWTNPLSLSLSPVKCGRALSVPHSVSMRNYYLLWTWSSTEFGQHFIFRLLGGLGRPAATSRPSSRRRFKERASWARRPGSSTRWNWRIRTCIRW